jgi:hypothetical protein
MLPFLPSIRAALRFATDALYPAGVETWSGAAVKVAPVANKLTPNEHPAAEELNYLFNDRGEALTECRADLKAIQRRAEIASLRRLSEGVEDLRSVAVTASGKMFRATHGNAYPFTRVGSYTTVIAKFLAFVGAPDYNVGDEQTVLSANGEKVLRCCAAGGPPACWIYDADLGTFSAGIYMGGGTELGLDAIPAYSGGGWVVLGHSDINYGNSIVNLSAPRTFQATGIGAFTVRTISSAGAIGADTASGALAAGEASGGFAPGDTLRTHMVRGKGQDIMILLSGRAGSTKYAAISGDDGATWSSVTLPDPFAGAPFPSTFTVEWCSITEAFVLIVDAFTQTNVYNTTDNGVTWVQLGATYNRAPAASWGVHTFGPYDLRRMSSGVLVALSHVCQDTTGGFLSPLHVSEDGGLTWNLANLVALPGAGFHTLAVSGAPIMALGGGSNNSWYGFETLGTQGL